MSFSFVEPKEISLPKSSTNLKSDNVRREFTVSHCRGEDLVKHKIRLISGHILNININPTTWCCS